MRVCLVLAAAMMLTVFGGMARASEHDDIVTSCETRLKSPTRTCACIADKAVAEFNANELAFFVAIMQRGVAGAMMVSSGLTQEEATHVASRVQVMPAECVNG